MKMNVLMVFAITTVMSLTINAQPRRMLSYSDKLIEVNRVFRSRGFTMPTESLDEKQREEIENIRVEQLKERLQTSNLLREKRVKLKELQTVNTPDMDEINKVIDEMAVLQAQEMKAQAASRQQIRNLLTEKQRVYYDMPIAANRENMRVGRKIRIGDNRFRGLKVERPKRVKSPKSEEG